MPAVLQAADARAYDLDGGALARDMATERVTTDPMNMSATCVFSTGAVDRVGDVVEVAGISTANHERNPVVFWNHAKQLTLPIGKTVDPDGVYTVRLGDDIATQTTFFSQSLLEAEQIFRLIDEGVINANSIAFDKKRVQPIYAGGRKGLHVLECDLLEISWVGLPVNPEAVRKAIDSLVCGRPLAEPVRRSLEPFAVRAAAWSNGVTLKYYAGRAAILKSAEFEENKHPRASDGRFGNKPGEHGGGDDDFSEYTSALREGLSPDVTYEEYRTRQQVKRTAADLSSGRGNFPVPLDEFRESIAERLGEDAPSREELDAMLQEMRWDGEIRLIALGDPEGWTDDRLRATIPGEGETFAYVEPVRETAADEEEDVDEPEEDEEEPDEEAAAKDRASEAAKKLPDRRPDNVLSANVALRDEGDYVISLVSGEPVHLDDYDNDLSRGLEKILPNIKKLADINSLNEELESIDDQERIFYNGLKPEVIDNNLDIDSLKAINTLATRNSDDLAAMLNVNDQLANDADYRVVPGDSKYEIKLMNADEIAGHFEDEGNAAGLSNLIDAYPESGRAAVVERWNGFLEDNFSDTRIVPNLDEGRYTAINTAMLDRPDDVAEYIVDQYGLSDGGEARVEWSNDLMAEYGSGDRLMVTLDESGDLVVEVADGPETAKGLRFWSAKSVVTS